MSERMDSLLDKERREEIARNDAALIASMFPLVPTVCRAKGNHLSAQNDEPLLDVFPEMVELNALECAKLREIKEADRVAADLARNANKGPRLAALNDATALDLQVQLQGYIGGLPQ